MAVLPRLPMLVTVGAILVALISPAAAATRTVCPAGCFSTAIQPAINASAAGDTVMVLATYDSIAAGEVFPIQTLALQPKGPLTIRGEVNASGVPVSTVRVPGNGAATADGIILVNRGVVLQDIRITAANALGVNRVVAAANAGGGFGNEHLQGLTLRNVVVDFTPGFNARNAFDLIADDVLIEQSTIRGVNENGIFVDGDRFTIRNNTLDGFAGPAVRGVLAIGFGADLKIPGQAVCSGFPLNYVIDGNLIRGWVDGIQWCTGRDNAVTNNVLQDIAGRPIETSGSQGTLISGNTILWTVVGGTHAIGLSANVFQGCSGNVVEANQITGRPQRDVQRGIVIQNCTHTQVRDNVLQNFGDADAALFYSMAAPLPTASLIQGNTIRNGNASGIVYQGADSGASAVDRTMIVANTVENHRRNGLIVQGIKGPGGMVGGNTVSGANQGLFVNTHGLNLQNLAGLTLSANQATGTAGAGAGFFLANAAALAGGCNTASGNGGGSLLQVNVSPPFQNPSINCPGSSVALLPSLDLTLSQDTFRAAQTLHLWANLAAGSTPVFVDAYVLVQLPDGRLFSVLLGGGLMPGMVPIATNFAPFSFSSTLLSYTFTGTEPLGSYAFMGMLTQAGTLNLIGAVDQAPFTVTP
jgi:hypothetical protein